MFASIGMIWPDLFGKFDGDSENRPGAVWDVGWIQSEGRDRNTLVPGDLGVQHHLNPVDFIGF